LIRSIINIIICLFIVSFADTTSAAFNKAEEFYLSNGMHVVVIPNHKAPVVHHTVLYKVGSIDEPQGKGGIAHLLEHLMFRGTHKFKDGKFDNLINFNGGKSNAATSQNYTYYYQLLGVQSLELAMYLEADRMYGLKLDNDIFIKEREVVYQERQQRMNADTTSSFWEQYNKIFWGDCPYGESISGTEREIKNISIDDIKEFYKNFYAPNNALLILSGDIDIQTAKNLAEKYYGSIKAKPIQSKANLEICCLPKQEEKVLTISSKRNDISVSRLVAQYMFPHFSGNDTQLYALILASSYLGDGVNSVLYKDIIDKYKLASSVGADFYYLSRGSSIFSFSAYFNDSNNLEKIKQRFYQSVKQAENSISEKHLIALKEKILSGIIFSQDNPVDASQVIMQWIGNGFSLNDLKQFEENINKVTLKDIKSALNLIAKSHHVWGEVIPQGGEFEN